MHAFFKTYRFAHILQAHRLNTKTFSSEKKEKKVKFYQTNKRMKFDYRIYDKVIAK